MHSMANVPRSLSFELMVLNRQYGSSFHRKGRQSHLKKEYRNFLRKTQK